MKTNSKTKTRYFKVLAPKNKHWGMTYKTNDWNTDVLPYNPDGECREGGLYFAPIEHIFTFLHYGNGIAEVLDYRDDKGKKEFYKEEFKMKAHAVKLGEKKLYSKELLKEFVDNGAKLNRLSEYWSSPISWLLYRYRFDVAEMLLELGADPSDGMTHHCMQFMIQSSNVGAINMLLKYYSEDQYRDYITRYGSDFYEFDEIIVPERLKGLRINSQPKQDGETL